MMQRIISLQMSRNAERTSSSEFVSKRLCCSFLFSVAFLSLLGGFLLGRYATDRAALLRNKQRNERISQGHMSTIMTSVYYINNATKSASQDSTFDKTDFWNKLRCGNYTVNVTRFEEHPDKEVYEYTSEVLNAHLVSLDNCFLNIRSYLEYFRNRSVTLDAV